MPTCVGSPCTSLPPSRTSMLGGSPMRIRQPRLQAHGQPLALEQRPLVDGRPAGAARANPEPPVTAGRHDDRPAGSATTTCFFLCVFVVVVWCEVVVVGAEVVGGVPLLVARRAAELPGRRPATIATMTATTTSGRRKPTPPKREPLRANRSGTSCGSSGRAKRLLYSTTQVPVEAEVVGVRAQEPLHVRAAGQSPSALPRGAGR